MKVDKLASKLMAAARRNGNACVSCGAQDGTVCGRHYNGLRQHLYGKGRGVKCRPLFVAQLCNTCDKKFQEGSVPKDDLAARIEYSEEFQHLCNLTLMLREEEGYFG